MHEQRHQYRHAKQQRLVSPPCRSGRTLGTRALASIVCPQTRMQRYSEGSKNTVKWTYACPVISDTSTLEVKGAHLDFLFSCTRDHRRCVGSRPNGQGRVDCLSPRAHQKSLIRLMFRGTLLESQFSSPSPCSSFCSTPLLAQTPLLNTSMS